MYVRCGEWRHERHLSFTFSPTQGRGRLAATAEPQKNTQIHKENMLKHIKNAAKKQQSSSAAWNGRYIRDL